VSDLKDAASSPTLCDTQPLRGNISVRLATVAPILLAALPKVHCLAVTDSGEGLLEGDR